DPKDVARVDLARSLEPLPVQVCSVGRAEILQVPRAVPLEQSSVELRRVAIVQPQVTRLGPADLHGLAELMRADLAPVLSPDHHDGRGFRLSALLGRGTRRPGVDRSRPSRWRTPDDLQGHGADGTEHEEVEERQERVLQHRDDERRDRRAHHPPRERTRGEHYRLRNSRTVWPMVIRSPSSRSRSDTVDSLTCVPLVEPRSVMTNPPFWRRISACRRDAPGSEMTMSHSDRRPRATTSLFRT